MSELEEQPKPEESSPSENSAEQPLVESTEVEGNKPEDEPSPEQTKATDVPPTPPEPPKEEPPKIPSKEIKFDYIPEGNMAILTAKDPDVINYMDCAAIQIKNDGRLFTYRRNRID